MSAIRDTVCGVRIPNAAETLWWCSDVRLDNVSAAGDYFAMGSSDIKVNNLELKGNYSFDGCRNVEISGSRLYSKDCIWNSENVVIRDSYIEGEYLAWNSRNITLSDKVDRVILKTEYLTAPKAAISITSYPPLKYGVAAFFKNFWTIND